MSCYIRGSYLMKIKFVNGNVIVDSGTKRKEKCRFNMEFNSYVIAAL